jgi:hypothetical protein
VRDGRLAGAAHGFLRFTIGLVLLTTAAGKLLDVSGFSRMLGTYWAFPDCRVRSVVVGLDPPRAEA